MCIGTRWSVSEAAGPVKNCSVLCPRVNCFIRSDRLSKAITSGSRYFQQQFKQIHLESEVFEACEFVECVFHQCSFVESTFQTTRFIECFIQECDLSVVQIPGAEFSSVRFDASKLIGVNWTQANWRNAPLGRIPEFYKCFLSHSTFLGMDLSEIQIMECIAQNVDFREAKLRRANLRWTDLSESLFINTDLTEADLRGARNYLIDPAQNQITQAKFSLPEAMGLLYAMEIDLNHREHDQDGG